VPVAPLVYGSWGPVRVVLKRRAHKLRKDTGIQSIVSRWMFRTATLREMALITISRPFRMILHESGFGIYDFLPLLRGAYPIIFKVRCPFTRLLRILGGNTDLYPLGIYKMSPGYLGLCLPEVGLPGGLLFDGILIPHDSRNWCCSRLFHLPVV